MRTPCFCIQHAAWLRAILLASMAASAVLAGSGERLPPATDPQIARLIEQLGDVNYFARQQAQEQLERLGFDAFDALSEAASHNDLEIAARARYLLRLMQVEWIRDGDPPAVRALLDNYAWLKADDRWDRARKLAGLPDAMGIAAVCRIVRFDPSVALSKRAATILLAEEDPADSVPEHVAQTVLEALRGSRRPGAQWLRSWLSCRNDPARLVEEFDGFIEAEQGQSEESTSSGDAEVLSALLRFQVAWLERLARRDQALDAMRRLIALEEGDTENLKDLLHWLIAREAWSLVDEFTARFKAEVQDTPVLLYLVAEAEAGRGNSELAEQIAEQAYALRLGEDRNWLNARRVLAIELWQRNRPDWAAREFRYVLETGAPTDGITLAAYHAFARMLHDRGEVLEAAEVLKTLIGHLERHPAVAQQLGVSLEPTKARMHYFLACHYHAISDYAKERENLDKALANDPDELDALIARYRLPEQDEAYRRETLRLIEQSAEALRRIIAGQPDEATWYNQFAWLIGNTEGDLDEALEYSRLSLELSPNEAAYYDTLAHVYFAKKDYASAVKYQARAARLEPHSKLIRDQLEVFRTAMESESPSEP